MSSQILEATVRLALTAKLPVISASDGIEALLGFTPEDFLSSRVSLKERIHPHDSEMAAELFSPEIPKGTGAFNIRLRHADGRIRCIKGHCAKYVAGGLVILDLLLQDARTLRQEVDKSSMMAHFWAMMEASEDYIYFKDSNHVFTAISQSASPANGIHNTNIVGMTDYDLLREEFADTLYRMEEQVFAGLPMVQKIHELDIVLGNRCWVDNRMYPIRASGGKITGVWGIARDITRQFLAEETLRESEELLRESQAIANLGSYMVDTRAGMWRSSEILDKLFGIDLNFERSVEGWVSIIHPDDRAMMLSHYTDEVLGQGKAFDKEYRIVRRSDQVVRWVHGVGRLEFDAQGQPLKMRGTIQDITESKQVEESLRESKELLQLFVEHAPAALAMLDREMRYLAVSRRYLEGHSLLGREITGHLIYEILPNLPESWKEAHRRGLAGEVSQGDADRYTRADGTEGWIRWEVHPWLMGTGVVGGIVIFAEDITGHRQAEERLRLAARVFTHAREGIAITAPDGAIIEVNDTFTQITGYSHEEVLGRNPRLLKSGLHDEEFYDGMWRALKEKGHWTGEVWNRRKDGCIYAEILTISAVQNASGEVQQYVALFSDITKVKEYENKLKHVAFYDVLTSLPNRVLLADRMDQAIARFRPLNQAMVQSRRNGQQMAVAYLDLDGFKAINDRHGHDVGDQLLTMVASRMKKTLRKIDTLARMGGDEFVAVMLDLENAEASIPMLKRLLDAVSQPVRIGDLNLQVSVSIGVTFFPQAEETSADHLLRQADQAMYQAKLAGKNRYHIFDFNQDRTARSRQVDLDRVRQALEAREFVLYYQPKVNMRKGTVDGAEALIRWQHPEQGLMLPGSFLPVIEDHPLAVELGEWVIDTALTQMECWQAAGLDIPVSVNVGARQLQEPNFVDRLAQLLAAHPRVKPSSLEMEILETSALADITQVSKLLENCNELGVSFSLDDFGTGYSSLSYLKRLPVNFLKIDWSFVRGILSEPKDLNIVEGIMGLAAAFRREVIAEGVETADHGLLLLRMGCELAQGSGIARPMPAADFPGWAATWQPDPRWIDVMPASQDERQLLYAAVEHRSWIAAIESFLKNERHVPPRLKIEHCRFGARRAAEVLDDREESPELQRFDELHRQIHALAVDIVDFRDRDRNPEPLARLDELHHLNAVLLDQLELCKVG